MDRDGTARVILGMLSTTGGWTVQLCSWASILISLVMSKEVYTLRTFHMSETMKNNYSMK